ncbi:hypothetical protein BCR43DRAFT_492737 [Syncephalastrum racemosum]|uniref:Uncharacterized protein n=1 Tax=Syncephalastrum racemosum TaxID=13706 RepID=A0A1X2HAQ6_SYNRA|nr:hypothetical protein BCR43DRAFT_492737 [Syncephalastrum racemosum]
MTKTGSSSAWPWQHHVEHFLNNIPRPIAQPSGSFRTAKLHLMQPKTDTNDDDDDDSDGGPSKRRSQDKDTSASASPPRPPLPVLPSTPLPAPSSSPSSVTFRSAADDGREVCQLLASDEYSMHVLSDTLEPDSTHYISWRHQFDTMHALADRNGTPNPTYLPHYLTQAEYTTDVHGLPNTVDPSPPPVLLPHELQIDRKEVARTRLQMTREHLQEKKIDKHA